MKYSSTRGDSECLEFGEVVLAGLARDGGLYLPENYPHIADKLSHWENLNYQQLAVEVMLPYVQPTLSREQLQQLVDDSYASFSVEEITPLVKFSGGYILELFHGPTFAFKDIALQFLGNLFEMLLLSENKTLNIVGATSGDTGSAAIYGVRGKKGIRIFMLHPAGKVSQIQELQMTTVLDENVFNLAVDGNFDDCQQIVKELFNDLEFRDEYQLGAVNSINFARILAQTVYYFYASFQFKKLHPGKPLIFSVPTGNFGDIFAGYIAKRMGLAIDKLIIGTNENDIISRTLETGEYRLTEVLQTLSPAMDIQISSNFERLLFELCDRDTSRVKFYMDELSEKGCFRLSNDELQKFQSQFKAVQVNKEKTLLTMKQQIDQNMMVDPHTAVGIFAAQESTSESAICLATAHPAKFPEAVRLITEREMDVPEAIALLAGKEKHCDSVRADKDAVTEYIKNAVIKDG